jgi:hypothetical protein
MMKQTVSVVLGVATILASIAFALVLPAFATTANWDATGNYIVVMNYEGTNYSHNMTLVQNESGQLSGNGGSPAGANVYYWNVQNGMVTGNSIEFTANYTATPDAVTPLTTMSVVGTIAANGSMSGTWSDNYAGGSRSGTWNTTSGTAASYTNTASSTVTVTVEKFIQGSMATADTADFADFPMTATWDAENIGAGSGDYVLSETNTVPYQAISAHMSKGADYETKELVNGNVVGAQCATGKPFALEGYTTGNTRAAAMAATPSMAKPTFTNLQHDKYVIVWNRDCSLPGGPTYGTGSTTGEISGNVDGDVELVVTSVDMTKTTAIANGSFNDGWKYIFHITAPMEEDKLSMKFDNWLRTGGGGTIPVANNMRISSLQADNSSTTILLTAANAYATPDLTMVGDLNPSMDGRQVQIIVEVAVPNGTPNGSYTTSYGVQSNP